MKRQEILQIISMNSSEYIFDKNNLRYVEKELQCQDSRASSRQRKQLADVLTELNTSGYLDAVLPVISVRVPRPSILPPNVTDYSYLKTIGTIARHYQSFHLKKLFSLDDLPAFLCLTLGCFAGIPGNTLTRLLITSKNKDINKEGTISLKIHPDDKSTKRCHIAIPRLAHETLLKLTSKISKTQKNEFILFPTIKGSKNRKKLIINAIKKSVSNTVTQLQIQATVPTVQKIFSLMPLISFRFGIEPFIISALKGTILPVSHPSESPFQIYMHNNSEPPRLIKHRPKGKKPTTNLSHIPIIKHTNTDNNIHLHIDDWCGKSKLVLRKLIYQLRLNWDKRLPDSNIDKARTIFQTIRDEANLITTNKSALHLAIDWIEYKFIDKQSISSGTSYTYLDRTFFKGFLSDPDSHDLEKWDIEDHELLLESCLSRNNISIQTKKLTADTFSSLYKFASEHGYCSSFNISYINSEWVGSTNRNEILGLHEFDSFIRILIEENTRDALTHAAVAILGFYAGLRAAEVTRLTLNDIILDNGYLSLEIQRGKSLASRRRVTLSLLVPEYILCILNQYITKRRSEFPLKSVLRNIPLFGPEGSRNRYQGRTLINRVINQLKYYFGNDIVFHSLRHCFASWLLVRWYALRYPSIVNELHDESHNVFSQSMRAKLAQLFTVGKYSEIPDWQHDCMITIAKIIGHASPKTFFHHYVHTFHVIHKCAVTQLELNMSTYDYVQTNRM